MELRGADDVDGHEEDGCQPDGIVEGVGGLELSKGGVRVAFAANVQVDTDIGAGVSVGVGVGVLFGLGDRPLARVGHGKDYCDAQLKDEDSRRQPEQGAGQGAKDWGAKTILTWGVKSIKEYTYIHTSVGRRGKRKSPIAAPLIDRPTDRHTEYQNEAPREKKQRRGQREYSQQHHRYDQSEQKCVVESQLARPHPPGSGQRVKQPIDESMRTHRTHVARGVLQNELQSPSQKRRKKKKKATDTTLIDAIPPNTLPPPAPRLPHTLPWLPSNSGKQTPAYGRAASCSANSSTNCTKCTSETRDSTDPIPRA